MAAAGMALLSTSSIPIVSTCDTINTLLLRGVRIAPPGNFAPTSRASRELAQSPGVQLSSPPAQLLHFLGRELQEPHPLPPLMQTALHHPWASRPQESQQTPQMSVKTSTPARKPAMQNFCCCRTVFQLTCIVIAGPFSCCRRYDRLTIQPGPQLYQYPGATIF